MQKGIKLPIYKLNITTGLSYEQAALDHSPSEWNGTGGPGLQSDRYELYGNGFREEEAEESPAKGMDHTGESELLRYYSCF